MARFRYSAVGQGGETIQGSIDGPSETAVLRRIRDLGYYPTSVTPVRKTSGGKIYVEELPGVRHLHRLLSGGRVRPRTMALFTRQMAVLHRAGIPLVRALQIVHEQTRSANLRRAVEAVIRDVESGEPLHRAMAAHPAVFSELTCRMVKAGESAGALEAVLFRLAEYQKKRVSIRSKVRSALMYPAVVFTLAAAIVSLILIFVIPRFQEIYESFNADLPGPTLVLIAVSEWIRAYLVAIGPATLVCLILYRFLRRTERVGYVEDTIKLRIPLVGDLFLKSAIARMTRTLSTLLEAGVPVLEALETASGTTGNRKVGRGLVGVRSLLREGETLTNAVQSESVFPPMLVHMVSVGEEAGDIDTMLNEIADVYEQEVDDLVNGLTDILEPLSLVVLGVIIGAIVIALYYPIFGFIRHL
jgi:type IV pilus assembly protein PilC